MRTLDQAAASFEDEFDDAQNVMREVRDLVAYDNAIKKLNTLIQVLHKSLVPCLVATPLVYCEGNKLSLSSHSDFRKEKRKLLDNLLSQMNDKNKDPTPIADRFSMILKDVLKVRIPAMPELYMNDASHIREKSKIVSKTLIQRVDSAKNMDFIGRIREIASIMLLWFTYRPVGRPHIYVSDTQWTLVAEEDLRRSYRSQIVSN